MEQRYKVDLSSYQVAIGQKDDKPIKQEWDVRNSLVEILFNPDLSIVGSDLLKRDDLARKIESCADRYLYLADEEFSLLSRSVEQFNHYPRYAVEMVRRIKSTSKVEVSVKPISKEKK